MSRLALLAAALLLAPSAAQAGDLDALLKSIPTIEDKEAAAKAKAAAEEAERERAADPLSEESLSTYVSNCQTHAIAGFKAPRAVRKKDPGAEITLSVKLYSDGTIMGLGVRSTSGNDKLTEAAVEAVQEAAPFPKPPVSLRPEVAKGIPIRFSGAAAE